MVSFSGGGGGGGGGGGLYLLKEVKSTRLGFCMAQEAKQFFSSSMKPNVHSVWLAQSGRKRLKAKEIKLVIHLDKHKTNLTTT